MCYIPFFCIRSLRLPSSAQRLVVELLVSASTSGSSMFVAGGPLSSAILRRSSPCSCSRYIRKRGM